MVKESVEFDARKIADIQKDVIHFERLIGDLVGILSKSISFCIHSGESINELVKQSVRNYEGMNDKNGDDPHIIIQESSYVHENDAIMNNNDNGIDYIRLTSNGPVYSLPKRITNSLVGSFIYECSQENLRTVDGSIYLDYHGDETLFPLLIDSLMNKPINVDQLVLKDQIELLGYLNIKYKEGDDVTLYINDKKDELLRDYWKKNGLWNKIINEYNYGYVDYDEKNNEMLIKKNYEYIYYIDCFALNKCIFIDDESYEKIDKELLEKEMFSIFGKEGKEAARANMNENATVFMNSTILKKKCFETPLVNWLSKERKWKLLFRASEHNYSAIEFHKYCDNQGETVVLIKHIGHNNHINIFGGYTDQNWNCSGDYIPSSKEFLFTLSNEHNIPPTKYKHNGEGSGICCFSCLGPIFGDGYDIFINDDCHTTTNSNIASHSFSTVDTPQKSSLFVNTSDSNSTNMFQVDEYEVWGRDK
ncbi:hypothetical protein WA158_001632 [Blastocystis sp. Blastoise]